MPDPSTGTGTGLIQSKDEDLQPDNGVGGLFLFFILIVIVVIIVLKLIAVAGEEIVVVLFFFVVIVIVVIDDVVVFFPIIAGKHPGKNIVGIQRFAPAQGN